MQRQETLSYWNNYHERDDAKEWILLPSELVLRQIMAELDTTGATVTPSSQPLAPTTTPTRLLEIGCGTSTLARELFKLHQTERSDIRYLATDVSPVCIESNSKRDERFIANHPNFGYEVLNAIQSPSSDTMKPFHAILDKGCLDTFLFRSQRKQQTDLLIKLLNNIHSWLTSAGKFIILTPRSKICLLRDFHGFHYIKRCTLRHSLASLDGSSSHKDRVYMHVCVKRDHYVARLDEPFKTRYDTNPNDEDRCDNCGVSFQAFRTESEQTGRSAAFWARTWNGHRTHCRMKT